ncbi:MAG: hypothetical protein SFV21_10960 [Rhodospirillaceae bacterium]|nr:hypothetical protein [Rhodospirillaceae bacterium]
MTFDDAAPRLDEVLFEMMVIGNAVKVSAIDPRTNTEVSIVGSPAMSAYSLKMNALRKLERALSAPPADAAPRPARKAKAHRRGLLV